ARRTGSAELRGHAHRLAAAFAEACAPEAIDLERARSLVYDRMNERYRTAHVLSWLVLDGLGVSDLLAPGERDSFAFLLDMNVLFERFVEVVLAAALGPTWRIRRQPRDRSILRDVVARAPYGSVIPDLLVERPTDGVRVAVDAKYKRYDLRKID